MFLFLFLFLAAFATFPRSSGSSMVICDYDATVRRWLAFTSNSTFLKDGDVRIKEHCQTLRNLFQNEVEDEVEDEGEDEVEDEGEDEDLSEDQRECITEEW